MSEASLSDLGILEDSNLSSLPLVGQHNTSQHSSISELQQQSTDNSSIVYYLQCIFSNKKEMECGRERETDAVDQSSKN